MPMMPRPAPGVELETKRVTPPDWDAEGDYAEWFDIVVYLRPEVIDEVVKASTETKTLRSGTTERIDPVAYANLLIGRQLKGWQVIAPMEDPQWVKDFEKRTELKTLKSGEQLRYWKFTPENVREVVPDDVQQFLVREIQACGGSVATESLITVTKGGKRLNFRRPPGSVHDRTPAPGVPDSQ